MATTSPPSRDEERLAQLGYAQELDRSWSGFQNFAISFTIISILAGTLTTYGQAWNNGGPVAISWGWPLISIPILLQVYFNSSLAYGLMRLLRVRHAVAAPGALIGASNFFELAVATAIALFGPGSGAALATVVGVLIEVPVMLSVCSVCNRTRHWFPVDEDGSPA